MADITMAPHCLCHEVAFEHTVEQRGTQKNTGEHNGSQVNTGEMWNMGTQSNTGDLT